MSLVSISVSRVAAVAPAATEQTDSNITVPTSRVQKEQPKCHICAISPTSGALIATFSCCHSLYHAECLSTWIANAMYSQSSSTSTSTVDLPSCPRCRARFVPTGFHTAMVEIATGQTAIPSEPGTNVREVRRINILVSQDSVFNHDLQYEPRTLLRQGLRGDYAGAWEQEEHDGHNDWATSNQDWEAPASLNDVEDDTVKQAASQTAGNSSTLDSWGESEEPSGFSGESNWARPLNVPTQFEVIEEVPTPEPEPEVEVGLYDWRYGYGQRLGTEEDTTTPSATEGHDADGADTQEGPSFVVFGSDVPFEDTTPNNDHADHNAQWNAELHDQLSLDDTQVDLYHGQHGYGQRLSATEDTTIPTNTDQSQAMVDEVRIALNRLRAPRDMPAGLYSNDHGMGQRLVDEEEEQATTVTVPGVGQIINPGSPLRNRRRSSGGINEELRVMGRFRHELGRGRRLGD